MLDSFTAECWRFYAVEKIKQSDPNGRPNADVLLCDQFVENE